MNNTPVTVYTRAVYTGLYVAHTTAVLLKTELHVEGTMAGAYSPACEYVHIINIYDIAIIQQTDSVHIRAHC